jgi:hypothetical protein
VNIVYSTPTVIFGPIFVAAIVGLSIAVLFLVRRWTPQDVLKEHNEIAGYIISVVGVIYAVALAFLVIVVWEDFNLAQITVGREVDSLTDIYSGVRVFPPAERDPIRKLILDYNGLMISDEWPAMQTGSRSVRAEETANEISEAVSDLQARNSRSQGEQGELLALTENFLDARRERLHQNESGLPNIMWWTMGLCGTLTISVAYLFGGLHRAVHAVLIGLLSGVIAIMFLLIVEINLPFRGDVSVSDSVWHSQRVLLDEYR